MPAPRERSESPRTRDRAARRPSRRLEADTAKRRSAERRPSPAAAKARVAPKAAPPPPAASVTAAADIPAVPRDVCDNSEHLGARDALVVAHSDLVRSIAYRIGQRLPPHVDRGDLVGVGMIGLIEAAARYRPSTGVPFEAFARRRVHGAIMDSLRDLDWVPRSVRSLQRRAGSAAAALRQQLGREPSREEVASHIGLADPAGASGRLLNVATATEPCQDDLSALEQWPDASETAEARLLRAEVAACVRREIARLPLREQKILDSYYRADLRMAEIGQAIGVCESRVSQLRSAALARLRVRLAPILGIEPASPRAEARWAAILLEGGLSRLPRVAPAQRTPVPAPARAGAAPACQAA